MILRYRAMRVRHALLAGMMIGESCGRRRRRSARHDDGHRHRARSPVAVPRSR